MKKVWIYALVDNRKPDEMRYIGYSTNPQQRLQQHINKWNEEAKRQFHKARWIRKVLSDGGQIAIVILDECTESNYQEREQHWIRYYRKAGHPLTNMTDGGDGIVALTPEARERWQQTRSTPEFREMLRKNQKGRKATQETKRKRGESVKAKYSDPEFRRMFLESARKPEKIEKIRRGSTGNTNRRGKKATPKAVENNRKAQMGNQNRRGTKTSPQGHENIRAENVRKARIKIAIRTVQARIENLIDQTHKFLAGDSHA